MEDVHNQERPKKKQIRSSLKSQSEISEEFDDSKVWLAAVPVHKCV